MPGRAYGVLVKRDRNLDEKCAQLARKNEALPFRDGARIMERQPAHPQAEQHGGALESACE